MFGQQRITGLALSFGPSCLHGRKQTAQIAVANAIFHQQQQGRHRRSWRFDRDLGSHNGLQTEFARGFEKAWCTREPTPIGKG